LDKRDAKVPLMFHVKQETHERLRRVSFETRVSMAAICRDAIEKELKLWEEKLGRSRGEDS